MEGVVHRDDLTGSRPVSWPHFRASLIAPSLASAPLFVKKTLSIAEWSTIFQASSRSLSVK